MMGITDHDFYTGIYLGSLIPAKAFPALALRSAEVLERFCRLYGVKECGEESLAMAVCAMAETLYTAEKRRGGVSAATVGEVSVRYEGAAPSGRSLSRELYEKASIYLDFCRGVG